MCGRTVLMEEMQLIYRYDGTFAGFLCCVFESYLCHEEPQDICPESENVGSLFGEKSIVTDRSRAGRVFASLSKRICPYAEYLVTRGFLHGEPGKEMVLYRFIQMGLKSGSRTVEMLGDATVSRLHHMVRAVESESHQWKGFLRFSEYRSCDGKGGLVAVMEPKHAVLPLMTAHFTGRYPEETFLIYDKAHRMLLLYRPYEAKLVSVENFEVPSADEEEWQYRKLWKRYYDSIGIEERENPRCRMNHMPKRFWEFLTEMQTSSDLPTSLPDTQTYLLYQNKNDCST